jgi:hypothetical protein
MVAGLQMYALLRQRNGYLSCHVKQPESSLFHLFVLPLRMLIDEQLEKAEMDSYRRMQQQHQQPQARALPTASKQEKYP